MEEETTDDLISFLYHVFEDGQVYWIVGYSMAQVATRWVQFYDREPTRIERKGPVCVIGGIL